jgi:hypothetical protein
LARAARFAVLQRLHLIVLRAEPADLLILVRKSWRRAISRLGSSQLHATGGGAVVVLEPAPAEVSAAVRMAVLHIQRQSCRTTRHAQRAEDHRNIAR